METMMYLRLKQVADGGGMSNDHGCIPGLCTQWVTCEGQAGVSSVRITQKTCCLVVRVLTGNEDSRGLGRSRIYMEIGQVWDDGEPRPVLSLYLGCDPLSHAAVFVSHTLPDAEMLVSNPCWYRTDICTSQRIMKMCDCYWISVSSNTIKHVQGLLNAVF